MITSPKNPQVARAAKLKKRALREKESRFLVEGAQAAEEALDAEALEVLFHVPQAGERIAGIARRAQTVGVRVVAVSDRISEHLTSAVTPQGIVGVARFLDVPLASLAAETTLVPVLCAVRDPGNAGTILRSADAAGADAVIVSASSVDVYNPKTVRASAGSLFHLPVVRDVSAEEAVAALRSRGLQVLAAHASGDTSVYEADLGRPSAFLLGNEAWGLPEEVAALADRTVRIPIRGKAESLNLAAATALLLFEAARQRSSAPRSRRDSASSLSFTEQVAAGAHDLRSPLAGLTAFASLVGDRWDALEDRERRDLLGGMALDAERASALTRLLVDGARATLGTLKRGEPGEISAVAASVASVFARSVDYPPVDIEGQTELRLDAERLHAILLVLCEAAARLGTEGSVVCRLAAAGPTASIEVSRAGLVEQVDPYDLVGGPVRGGPPGIFLAGVVARELGGTLTASLDRGVSFRLEIPGA